MTPFPLLRMIDAMPARVAFVRACLAPLGWVVIDGEEGDAAALVLIDPALPDAHDLARRLGRAGAGPPVLAFAGVAVPVADPAPMIDGSVPWPCTPEALIAAIRLWQPVEMVLDRLATTFGAARLASLLAGFDTQLGEALDRLDAGGAEGVAGLAHRVGGLAGTLGFARVSAAWLAVSEGDGAAVPAARTAALAARAAIGRRIAAA